MIHLQGDRAKWDIPVKKVSYVFVSLLQLHRPQRPLNLLDLFLSWKCMFSFICVTNFKGIKEFFNFINSDENTRTLFVHNICLQSSSRFPLTACNIKISPDFPGMKNLWKSTVPAAFRTIVRNSVEFVQNFCTIKLDKTTVYYAGSNWPATLNILIETSLKETYHIFL